MTAYELGEWVGRGTLVALVALALTWWGSAEWRNPKPDPGSPTHDPAHLAATARRRTRTIRTAVIAIITLWTLTFLTALTWSALS